MDSIGIRRKFAASSGASGAGRRSRSGGQRDAVATGNGGSCCSCRRRRRRHLMRRWSSGRVVRVGDIVGGKAQAFLLGAVVTLLACLSSFSWKFRCTSFSAYSTCLRFVSLPRLAFASLNHSLRDSKQQHSAVRVTEDS